MLKNKKYILVIFVLTMINMVFGANPSESIGFIEKNDKISSINIFAGNDTSICTDSYLDMTQMGAYISGDVLDGTWITYGDGTFSPSGISNGLFSTTTGYTLGANDIATGSITLVLVSDDPDGIGPNTEVSDLLEISLLNQPALACVGNISLSLNNDCTQTLQVGMLLTNPIAPFDYYTIESYDEFGVLIENNILSSEHIGQEIEFLVGHSCGDITCGGIVSILDKHIPSLVCPDIVLKCNESMDVLDIGLPIPIGASIISHSGNVFEIADYDPCSDVTLTYTESIQNFNCLNSYTQIITRFWQAVDDSENSVNCYQKIYVERIALGDIVLPQNYDDINYPSLTCVQVFDTLENGAPSILVTGRPIHGNCTDFDVIFNDHIIPDCGNSFKVIRKWFIYDNCTAESLDYNQLIRIADTLAPVILTVHDTLLVSTNPYSCLTDVEIPLLEYDDCSNANFDIEYLPNYIGDTIPVNGEFVKTNVINQGDSLFYIDQLPIGKTWIKYIVKDDCLNKTYYYRLLHIDDEIAPYMTCKSYFNASLTNLGKARVYAISLDNGSWDNCSDLILKVRKMSDTCGINPEGFHDYVDFCCEEVGDTIMVALEATDASGNRNICMVELTINDKTPPLISAPDDITISCTYLFEEENLDIFGSVVTDPSLVDPIIINDELNSGVVGYDGLAEDNCNVYVSDTAIFDIHCRQGTITRIFTAIDDQGLIVSDEQIIRIENPNPFTEYDIYWPLDTIYTGCVNLEIDTSEFPTYDHTICGIVGGTYEDEIFEVVQDACVKILRHWTVVDWCQFDNDHNTGIFTHTQIIKVLNHEAPEIISSCADTLICLYETDCGNAWIELGIEAQDDCTPRSDLLISWKIYDEEDVFVSEGVDDTLHINIFAGSYYVDWDVEDLCGNRTSCRKDFQVRDCKLPTPYCRGTIVTTLMNDDSDVEIWASDYNLDSYDNCTIKDDLIFSFSTDVDDQTRSFNCNSLDNGIAQSFELQMWVTDEFGNQDYCTVYLLVQDNMDNCPNQSPIGAIGGHVQAINGNGIAEVDVDFNCQINEYANEAITDGNGQFYNVELLDGVSQVITPTKTDDYINGVTTFDLIMIQRHILRFKPFESPYKLIAADINNSKDINFIDLIFLRKLILGKFDEFPSNDSWRFVAEDYEFPDAENPWEFQDSILIPVLDQEYLSTNFLGIKIGDVNSFYENAQHLNNGDRYQVMVDQKISEDDNENIYVDLSIDAGYNLNGYQMQVYFDTSRYEFVSLGNESVNLDAENYNFDHLDEGRIRLLWYIDNGFADKNMLSDMIFKAKDGYDINDFELTLDDHYSNEIYIDYAIHTMDMSEVQFLMIGDVTEEPSIEIYPNPFTDLIQIDRTLDSEYRNLKIYDISGALIFKQDIRGMENILIPGDVFPAIGNYFIQLIGENHTISKKIIKI